MSAIVRPLPASATPAKAKVFEGLPDLGAGLGVKLDPYPPADYPCRQTLSLAELQDFDN